MPYCETLKTPEGIDIAIWHLTETLPTLCTLWGNKPLPNQYIEAKADKRRCEILAVRLLLRHYIGTNVELLHEPNGKPYITSYKANISISHTKSYIAVAFHPTLDIGIDIEEIGSKAIRVVKHFLHPQEIDRLPHRMHDEAIHICWSAKEAVYKISPSAVDFCNNIYLIGIENIPDGSLTAQVGQELYAVNYLLYKDCSMAYVLNKPLVKKDDTHLPEKQ